MGARNGRAPDAFCEVLGDAIALRAGRNRPLCEVLIYGSSRRYSQAPHDWPPEARELVLAVSLAHATGGIVRKHVIEAAIAAQWGELR